LETYVKQWSWNTPEHKLIVDLTAINEIIVKIPIITVKWEIELHEFDPEIKDFVENGTVKDEVIEFKDIPYDHNTGLYSTDRAMFKILKEKHGDGWYAVKFQPKLISSKNIITMKTKKITHDEKCSKIKEILSPYCLNGEIVNIGETLDEYTVYISAKHIVSSNIRIPLGNELISHHSLKDEDAIKMYNLGLIWYEKLNIWMF
jgi:hypothetical protein